MKLKNHTLTIALAFGLVLGACLTGCGRQAVTADSVRANMTPELETISRSRQQRLNRNARALDTTGRQFHDDWDKFWLIDRPLRLSDYSIP